MTELEQYFYLSVHQILAFAVLRSALVNSRESVA